MKLQNRMINLQKEAINKLTNDVQKQKEKEKNYLKIEEVTKNIKKVLKLLERIARKQKVRKIFS